MRFYLTVERGRGGGGRRTQGYTGSSLEFSFSSEPAETSSKEENHESRISIPIRIDVIFPIDKSVSIKVFVDIEI